jgi:hypothetical protein
MSEPNPFDELKLEIQAEFPSLDGLDPWTRFWARRAPEMGLTKSRRVGKTEHKQSAVLVEYRGRAYLKRWGKPNL